MQNWPMGSTKGWIYDMKELPSGKDVIPFYTVGTLSTNV